MFKVFGPANFHDISEEVVIDIFFLRMSSAEDSCVIDILVCLPVSTSYSSDIPVVHGTRVFSFFILGLRVSAMMLACSLSFLGLFLGDA